LQKETGRGRQRQIKTLIKTDQEGSQKETKAGQGERGKNTERERERERKKLYQGETEMGRRQRENYTGTKRKKDRGRKEGETERVREKDRWGKNWGITETEGQTVKQAEGGCPSLSGPSIRTGNGCEILH
jgi:hypothetical protein